MALTFCTILGGLAYWPINAATTDLKGSVAIITEKMVSQQEMEWRSSRGAEDRLRQEASLNDLRGAQVLAPSSTVYGRATISASPITSAR
ncbi:hypothetical protein [Sinorhizobium medicae]|uniref:hypothetical protein n=1 Tax=Sinorhizobium medicae TaxID=110321 RepID=UPI001F1877AB|nr:hypothetical protein [Sinorhizobium medicae]